MLRPEQNRFCAVLGVIESYFEGLHSGDSKQLRGIFDPNVILQSPGKQSDLNQWLKDVETRSTPRELGHPFDFKVLAIEIVNEQAMVKVDCPLFEHSYIDYLGLLEEAGRWRIVSKMYIDTNSN